MRKIVLMVVSMIMIGCESPTAVDKCPGLIGTVLTGRATRFPGTVIVTPDNPAPAPTGGYGVTFSVKGANGCEEQTVDGFSSAGAALEWFFRTYPEYR
jgi:hypothetical protein